MLYPHKRNGRFFTLIKTCLPFAIVVSIVVPLLTGLTRFAHGAEASGLTSNSLHYSGTVAYPLFAMDPSVRRLTGPVEEKIDLLKSLDYSGLSTNDPSLEGLRRVISAAESRGTKVHALYLSCPLTTTGIVLPNHFDEICQALGKHGALLWLYMPSKTFEPSAKNGDAVAVPALQAAAERANKSGVKLALYHHRDNWAESFADAIRVAGKVDRPNFGVSFNLCHSLAAGEEEQISALLQQAGNRLFMVTINGADPGAAGQAWERLIQPIGQGKYDLGALLKVLREIGYEGPFGFQSFGIAGDATEILRASMAAWKKLTGHFPDPK